MSASDDLMLEIASRVRRIETRQVKHAEAQGVDVMRHKTRISLSQNSGIMVVNGLDISLGDIVDFLKISGIKSSVVVVHSGESLITVQLSKPKE